VLVQFVQPAILERVTPARNLNAGKSRYFQVKPKTPIIDVPEIKGHSVPVGDRAVALASSPGEDNNVGLSLANYVGTREDPSSAIAVGNPPRAISDTEQTPGTQMAGQKVPSSKNSPLSQALATLSGAMLAAAFGWHLVNSSRRRISLGVGT
jgi:hypothetical protein